MLDTDRAALLTDQLLNVIMPELEREPRTPDNVWCVLDAVACVVAGLRAHSVADLARRGTRADAPHLKALLAPYPSEEMVAWPVSVRVGNVKNNDPSLIEPIAAAG
jgi:hypothetical protein